MIPALKPQHDIFVPLAEFRLVLVLTPKAASSAIVDCVHRHYGANYRRPYHGNTIVPWLTLDQVNEMIPAWKRAMFVRNPFDRLVGCYQFHVRAMKCQMSKGLRDIGVRPDMDFAEFLWRVLENPEADAHTGLQCWQSDRVDFLGRFESLSDDWDRLRNEMNIALPDLAVVNAGRSTVHWREFYSSEWRKKTARVYAPDLEGFGYSFD